MYIRLSPNNLRLKLVVLLNKLLDKLSRQEAKISIISSLKKELKKIILKYMQYSVAFFQQLIHDVNDSHLPESLSFFTQSITIVIQITTDIIILNGHINPSNEEDVVISIPNHTPSMIICVGHRNLSRLLYSIIRLS